MCSLLSQIWKKIFGSNRTIRVRQVIGSDVDINVADQMTIVSRQPFEITVEWFDKMLAINYDQEIKIKYIPELHQSNDFERDNLYDILDFQNWKGEYVSQIGACEENFREFALGYEEFWQLINSENIEVNAEDDFTKRIVQLYNTKDNILAQLRELEIHFEKDGYRTLSERKNINAVNIPHIELITFVRENFREILSKIPLSNFTLYNLVEQYNHVANALGEFNEMLDYFKAYSNYKIIAGNAGTGKTHMSAFIVNQVQSNNDHVLFFKAKQFSGDGLNFEERFLQLLQLPFGYTLPEVLEKLNNFAKNKNRRCFIVIDALNETTKSSIGFSDIWRINLQVFLNTICHYSNLYLVCSLRTSYIDQIWSMKPKINELRGLDSIEDIQGACTRYFDYYKIRIDNWHTADLSYFKIPLLLDLFCKITNERREIQRTVSLNLLSYTKIFDDYLKALVTEVRNKLGLLRDREITRGFSEISGRFYSNNQAVVSIDDFYDAFDKNEGVLASNSISNAVIEGYLIFIRDFLEKDKEVVMYTQQEVGGFLLAKNLYEINSDPYAIVENQTFKDKIIGLDSSKYHQLRLDILKFLIALNPEIILYLKDKDSLKLAWWYLYNGFDYEQKY